MALDLQSPSDEDLARRSQGGDLTAFDELVRRYENRIYSFVFETCRNNADAREITQDAFVRAFKALPGFDASRRFAPWLFTIARNKAIDCIRARARWDEGGDCEQVDTADPGQLAARREDAQDLWHQARTRLPRNQFQTLWLRYAEDMDIGQIARVMGKTQTHVKVLLFRARRRLAKELPAAWPAQTPDIPPPIMAKKELLL